MRLKVTASQVRAVALATTGKRYTIRQFRALFGVSQNITAICWELMLADSRTVELGIKIQDLLKALHFLKCYSTETQLSKLFGITEKTFRERYKPALHILADLPVICWENRKVVGNMEHKAKISIDGTDCCICEQYPFDGKWFSHKFKGPGLRYELAVCILTGQIVWIFGGFPCGEFPDLKIFRLGLLDIIDHDERVIADGGYKGEESIWAKGHSDNYLTNKIEGVIRARHETINSRLKNFSVLSTRFRHSLDMHSRCFHACAHLIHLVMKHEMPAFEVDYNEL